jgi:ABC-2 type transport system ATP-binding protein
MAIHAIRVRELRKTYRVQERDAGLRAALKGLVNREYREVKAVDSISFDIGQGEVVGFLGPNGAGKTTTLKVLSGVLYPSSGETSVLGHTPWKRERDYLRQISLLMGNRNQLQWDIPAADSYEMNRAIYQIPKSLFRATMAELVELLDIADLVRKPVRTLSLGERMKVELAGSLLHLPKVLFLDEPTLGLDVKTQKRLRGFVAEHNARHGATVLLTSHYMADVEALCERVIIMNKGGVLYDGAIAELADRTAAYKDLKVTLADPAPDLARYGEVIARDGDTITLRVPKRDSPRTTAALLADHEVVDLTAADPSIEDLIELVFAEEALT